MAQVTALPVCVGLVLLARAGAAVAAPPDEPARDDAGEVEQGDPDEGEPTGDEPAPDEATSEATEEQQLEELVHAGGVAYQLGDFDLAIEKLEAAYELSPQPRLLYNVALAYFRRHGISGEARDLLRAKALLTNFDIELQRNPSLADAENVERLVGQIDEKIAAHEAREQAREQVLREQEAAARREAEAALEPECSVPELEAAVRPRNRKIGASLMGLGAASLAGGVASLAAFAAKGVEFKHELTRLKAEREAQGCAQLGGSQLCESYDDSIAGTRVNGRRANVYAGAIGGSLTALGAAGLIAGAVVFWREGEPREQERRPSVRVLPGLPGLVFVGRF